MSLEHAILGFLNYEPMTGYELKKMVDISISHFWPAVQSQIYKTLKSLEKEKWLTYETITQETRPPRKVYSITPIGREQFYNWLVTPHPQNETKIAWMVQLFFAGQLEDPKIIFILKNLLENLQHRQQAFTMIPEENRETMQDDDPRDRFFWLLTADYGVAQTISQIQWLKNVILTVEQRNYHLPTLGD
jgi:DNA-binding PadR family transcriptional regulator